MSETYWRSYERAAWDIEQKSLDYAVGFADAIQEYVKEWDRPQYLGYVDCVEQERQI
jgi:hypothetical protein